MIERVNLILDLVTQKPKVEAVVSMELLKRLDEALALVFGQFTLAEAQEAWRRTGRPIDVMFDSILPTPLVFILSKRWDPNRNVPKTVSHTRLAEELRELVHGDRQPFDPSPMLLAEFRSSGTAARDAWLRDLRRFGDRKQIGAIVKSWDPYHPSPPTEPEAMLDHLEALALGRQEPARKFDPKAIALSLFMKSSEAERTAWLDDLARFGTPKQLLDAVKKWDPKLPNPPASPEARIAHLRALASGRVAPYQPPKPAGHKKSRPAAAPA